MRNRTGLAPSTTPTTQADQPLRRVRAGLPTRTVLERFPAGHHRGSRPAEQFAADRRAAGEPAEVVMDLRTDTFLVVVPGGAR